MSKLNDMTGSEQADAWEGIATTLYDALWCASKHVEGEVKALCIAAMKEYEQLTEDDDDPEWDEEE
jgi:hypothetical protein